MAQQTLQEAAERFYPVNSTGGAMEMLSRHQLNNSLKQEGFIECAKWMQNNTTKKHMEKKSMLEQVIDNLKEFNENKRMENNDHQIGGNHYKVMKIEPVTFIIENDIPFVEGNIIKYVCRWKSKGGVEDLKKARHYIDMLIKFNA